MLIAVTTIDIVGSKAFNQPLTGSLGLIRLAQLTAISFGMGITFLDGDHVKVEMLSRRLPPKVQATMSSLVNFLGFMLFFLIIWQMISLGRSFQISGEMIDELYIPWYPFIYATVVAFVPVCLALLLELGNSLSRVVKR